MHTHTCKHANTHTHTCMHAYIHAYIQTYTHTNIYIQTDIDKHMRTTSRAALPTTQRIPNVVIHRVIHQQNLVADPVTRVAARATHVTHIAGCAKCACMFRTTHRNASGDCDGRVQVDQVGSAGQVEGGVRQPKPKWKRCGTLIVPIGAPRGFGHVKVELVDLLDIISRVSI